MENRASKNRSANIAFVLTPDLLRRLAVILGEASEQLEFTVKFADGVSVNYANVKEIVEQPNSERRSIVGMIVGTTGGGTPSANVVLKSKFVSAEETAIEYTLTGPQRNVIYLADQLDDWVAATSQWYSRALSPVFMIPAVICAVFLPMYIWSYASRHSVAIKALPPWVGLIAFALMWAGEFYFFKLFPRGTFAIGRGSVRHKFLSSVRWGVIVALFVSFLGGIAANLLTRH
jgi:hypothetical protein